MSEFIAACGDMLFVVPMSFLADVDQFDPFHEVKGAPFTYPGSYEPGRELNNQVQVEGEGDEGSTMGG